MRLFTLLITFLSAVAALTLNKIDGTTIELGDEPAVVDLSNVIIPARAPVIESSAHNARDATDVNAADWDRSASNVHFYQHTNYKGSVVTAYHCRDGMNSCMTLLNTEDKYGHIPSSIYSHYRAILNSLRRLPRRTGHCEPTARSLFLHGSVGNLATNPATIGWNDKIKSVDCRWDQL
ncbi:hypothetical protein AA0113_g3041 [Alternaria arborescens]|uniref:Ecp2 effector protein domain-containing protein n=1 Tax=Alternaria arborescens TaxID=156630 RepID=A0A4Q4SI65_9PLEO|nr:hypothetical protein AA0111_g2355 [Alternaria arborescens]RYO37788.1 hypothetical protein AA0111_g2355 [Alternaria arborescens]RYO70335.1 hypothetical protein AA0113_g3041 [Alternaria arborescens]